MGPVPQHAVRTPTVVDIRQGRVAAGRKHSGADPAAARDHLVGDDPDLDVHGPVHVDHMETEERVAVCDGPLVRPGVQLFHETVPHRKHPAERRHQADADAVLVGLGDDGRAVDDFHRYLHDCSAVATVLAQWRHYAT